MEHLFENMKYRSISSVMEFKAPFPTKLCCFAYDFDSELMESKIFEKIRKKFVGYLRKDNN